MILFSVGASILGACRNHIDGQEWNAVPPSILEASIPGVRFEEAPLQIFAESTLHAPRDLANEGGAAARAPLPKPLELLLRKRRGLHRSCFPSIQKSCIWQCPNPSPPKVACGLYGPVDCRQKLNLAPMVRKMLM